MITTLIRLFLNFMYIGAFSFGGGYAMMPLIQEVVVKYGWMTDQGFADMIAISQITPGPIAINMATYVGYTTAGIVGALAATIAVCLPAMILVCVIINYIIKYRESKLVSAVFEGLRPAVIGLIAAAAYKVAVVSVISLEAIKMRDISNIIEPISLLIMVGVMICIYKFKSHPILYIIAAGIVGAIFL